MEDEVKVLVKEATSKGYAEAKLWDSINLEQPNSKTRRGRVGHQVAQTLTTSCNQAVVEPFIVASRGRYPEPGISAEQRLEPNMSGCTNTITTVQKDNFVCEPRIKQVGNLYPENPRNPEVGRVYDPKFLSPCLNACGGENRMPKIATSEPSYRIRKLTPNECFKLMGFTSEDLKKASDVGTSNSQLYKQAGNSIVVNVLEALFVSLGEKYEDFRCQGSND